MNEEECDSTITFDGMKTVFNCQRGHHAWGQHHFTDTDADGREFELYWEDA